MTAYVLLPLVQTLFCLVLIAVVLKGRLQSFIHRLFSIFLLALAIWGIVIFSMRASPDIEYAYSWEKWLVPVGGFISVLFYHFSARYTATEIKSWLLPVFYLICLLSIPLAQIGLVFSGMQIKPYGYAPILGPVMPFWFLFSYVVLLMALLNFVRTYRTSSQIEQRNRILYIIIGAIFAMVGGTFDILPVLGLPLYPGAIFGNIIFCLLASVALVKYHLLDVSIIIRRGTAYFLISAVVAIPYVVIIFFVAYVFRPQEIPLWVYLFLLLILAVVLQPLWALVQRQVDKLFYRGRYDYLKALKQFSLEAQSIDNSKQLNATFVQLVSQAMQTSGCYLLLPSSVTGDFTIESSNEPSNPIPKFSLGRDSPLIQYLRRNDGFIRREDLGVIPRLQALAAQEKVWFQKIKGELYVPLKCRGKLIGVLILGPKLSHQPYSLEEERLLITIANQMAINLDNAYLYDTEQEKRVQVEALQEQRNEFILAMSHELKTPLTSIKLSSEMLAEEAKLSPESPEGKLLKNLHLSANSMERRVIDLLDFLKLQTSSLEFKPRPEDVRAVLKDVMSFLAPLISVKRQTLTAEISPSLPEVVMDRHRFEQILLNLLSNANRYTPTGGEIKLRAKVRDNELMIEVDDNGPGIPLDEQELVFEPYYRVKGQSDHSLGLGLSIAKSLVELHGGKIWLDSQPGKGCTFSFTIPLAVTARMEK